MMRFQIRKAVAAMAKGGVIAYPTEAVYGLGCDPQNSHAAHQILHIKLREESKGLILIASDISQLEAFVDFDSLPATRRREIEASWPGPVTWLIPVHDDVPHWLTGDHDTLAVRVTAHPVARALCEAAGHAIISTSANVSGRPAARSAMRVRTNFAHQLDYILGGSPGKRRKPSEIRDARTGEVIRPG